MSVQASLAGRAGLALGNVVGSNIFNVLFILGLSALITPLAVQARLVRREIPVMIAVSVACLPVFFTGWSIGRWEGLLLLGSYGSYLAYVLLAQ